MTAALTITVAAFVGSYLIADALLPKLISKRQLYVAIIVLLCGLLIPGSVSGFTMAVSSVAAVALLISDFATRSISMRIRARTTIHTSPDIESTRQTNTHRDSSASEWLLKRAADLSALALIVFSANALLENGQVPDIFQRSYELWPPLTSSSVGQNLIQIFVITTGVIVTVLGGTSFVTSAITPFANQLTRASDSRGLEPRTGFIEGGRTIGKYERLLVFLFVLAGSAPAIGFLITAKSIFRFGDLTEPKNRQKAEYILLGTLASFTFALVTASLTRAILGLPLF